MAKVRSGGERFLARHRGLSVVGRVAGDVLREQSGQRVGLAASGAAFWIVISAFPTAIAAVNLYGLFVNPRTVAAGFGHLAGTVPGSLGSLLTEQLRRVAATDHAHLSVSLVLSLVLAVWSASAGFTHLDGAIRAAYGVPPQRYFEARGRILAGTLAVVLVLGLVAVATPFLVRQSSDVLDVLGVAAVLVVMTAGVGVLYRYSVGAPRSVRSLLPGAVLSAVGVVLVTAGFGVYVSFSSHYTAMYGAFAGAVIAMLAIFLAVYVVLLGAVLNTQLEGRTPERD
jgi:membrane protein